MNPWFERDDKTVNIRIDSNLGTCRPVYIFHHNCNSQEEAELVVRHFREESDNYKKKIAKNAILYLDPEDVSDLKRNLQDWSTRNHTWKQ